MFTKDSRDKERDVYKSETKTLRRTNRELQEIQDKKDEIIDMKEMENQNLQGQVESLKAENDQLRAGVELAKSSSGSTLKRLGMI